MRLTREQMLMEIAQVVARRGTCSRASVGVVIALDGRVLSTGYNGAPAGMDHCNHTCDCGGLGSRAPSASVRMHASETLHYSDCNSEKPCNISVHAEANAIAWAARTGAELLGAEMYTTLTPCVPCAQLIINSGIVKVYALEYYRDLSGWVLLENAGIDLEHKI